MLRRLPVLVAVLAGTIVSAVPASADAGTQTLTVHSSSQPPIFAPLPCSSLAGWNEINEDSGNSVIHFTGNANGFWVTGTYEGDVIILPAKVTGVDANGNPNAWALDPNSGRPSAQGHIADWFGESFNAPANAPAPKDVSHDAANAQLTTSGGQSITIHAVDHIQTTFTSSGPVVTHQFSSFTCS